MSLREYLPQRTSDLRKLPSHNTMPVRMGSTRKPITWGQVVALKSTMHNTVRQMWVMEVDIHSILGQMCRMESEVAGCYD